jgi:hypothetical protein
LIKNSNLEAQKCSNIRKYGVLIGPGIGGGVRDNLRGKISDCRLNLANYSSIAMIDPGFKLREIFF